MKRILEMAIGGFLGAVLLWYVAFRIYPPASPSIPQKAISSQSLTSSNKDSQGISATPNSAGSPMKQSYQDKDAHPTGYIPVRNLHVNTLFFFECYGILIPIEQRQYTSSFPQLETLTIGWDFYLEYPGGQKGTNIIIKAIITHVDGGKIAEINMDINIKDMWDGLRHSDGCRLPTSKYHKGNYTLTLYYLDQKIAEGSFQIY